MKQESQAEMSGGEANPVCENEVDICMNVPGELNTVEES